jgi:uncharacterized protein YqjF (DUF2071 family)
MELAPVAWALTDCERFMAERLMYSAPSTETRLALRQEPQAEPVMYQTWRNLLFLHWEWDPEEIQATLPPGLYVDTHHDKAYVGVTPFSLNDVRASFLPEIPGTADFLELNVRTYVYDETGTPGVWFYSLDCNSNLAVLMAKLFYALPYHSADMQAVERAEAAEYNCEFICQRRGTSEKSAFRYRKLLEPVSSQPGSLPFFLVERYLLYAYARTAKTLLSARVYHTPYELFRVHLGLYDDTMLRLNNLDPHLRPPDRAELASPLRVKIYAPQEVGVLPVD